MARGKVWIAIDFDYTLWDTSTQQPMSGAQEALDAFHELGWRVMIHSANKPAFIRKMCEEHHLSVDAIWGEHGEVGKPPASCYVDDCGVRFNGDWARTVQEVLALFSNG